MRKCFLREAMRNGFSTSHLTFVLLSVFPHSLINAGHCIYMYMVSYIQYVYIVQAHSICTVCTDVYHLVQYVNVHGLCWHIANALLLTYM